MPSALRARSFITHMFVHAGWIHLLGNLFMLLLAGPPIEDRYGRAMFAGFYAIAGLFAAVFYASLASDPTIPMVGASGAIAGVLGAFAVRLWSSQIRFAYFFLFGFRPVWGTFEAPAWAMLSLWFGTSCSRRGSGTRSASPGASPTGRTSAASRSARARPTRCARPASRSASSTPQSMRR